MVVYPSDVEQVSPSDIKVGNRIMPNRAAFPWMIVKKIVKTEHGVYRFTCETPPAAAIGDVIRQEFPYREFDSVRRIKKGRRV